MWSKSFATPALSPSHGSLTLNTDGTFTYTPNTGFMGTDSFTYIANDGVLDSAPATVTIEVFYVNQPPAYTFQLTLLPGGRIKMVWDTKVSNYGSTFAPNAIIGVTPGGVTSAPPSSDLSANPSVANGTIFEEFTAPLSFDLRGRCSRNPPHSEGRRRRASRRFTSD